MRLALFDDCRLGAVSTDGASLVDLTGALPWPHDPDPFAAGWWRRLVRDFGQLRDGLERAATSGRPLPIREVRLAAPVLDPGKIVACAANHAAHAEEMLAVQARVGGDRNAWMNEFDVFLKAPTSIVGPGGAVRLPPAPVAEGAEVHYECELAVIIGRGGAAIPPASAIDHVLGYTIGLDMTVRGAGDRSRRKSYDTFTPLGPWLSTADEVGDPHDLEICLGLGGQPRQRVRTGEMLRSVPEVIAYASGVMRLEPGDVILTGSPPGVGAVAAGDRLEVSSDRLGSMRLEVEGPTVG